MEVVESRLEFLRSHQNADGGWGYFPGQKSRVEPTCYALRALGAKDPRWQAGITFLTACQDTTGGLAPGTDIPGATWITLLAFPLLKMAAVDPKHLEKAGEWITNVEGAEGTMLQRLLYSLGKAKVDQDPKLRGWPWRPNNNSWVEPTVHGLLALSWMPGIAIDIAIRHRRDMATKMLLDRRCTDGGWNYGNKRVLGETLPSYPETTGIALVGLSNSGLDLASGIEMAKKHLATTKGAYARAWLTLALNLHKQPTPYTTDYPAGHPSRNISLAGLEVLAARGTKEYLLP